MISSPENILVIRLSALGDIILSMGMMRRIRERHPSAQITLLTTRPFVDMAQRCGYFNAVIEDEKPGLNPLAWTRLFSKLNAFGFTHVYDLQVNDRTSFYARLFVRRPRWMIRGAHDLFPMPPAKKIAAYRRKAGGAEMVDLGDITPDLSWMQADISLFGIRAPYVLLVPGSAPQHPEKRWPALKYGGLALRLMRDGYHVVLLGTAAESDVMERIARSAPGVMNLSGKTSFYDIAEMARGAVGAVGNDTGPMHVISLCDCPVVSLFSGTTDPAQSAPKGKGVTVIQSEDIADISIDDVMKNFKPRTVA